MDLENLNIVAVAPPTSVKPIETKKKRNTKYERRRRKAQQARQRKEGNSLQQASHSLGMTKDGTTTKLFDKAQSKTKNDHQILVSDNDEQQDLNNKHGNNLTQQKEDATNLSSDHHDDIPNSPPPQQTFESSHSNYEYQSFEIVSSSRGGNKQSQSQSQSQSQGIDEDYAEYLAEFHARPLELDRRVGAVKTGTTPKSMESNHLFAELAADSDTATSIPSNNDHQENTTSSSNNSLWNTLPLHPRLKRLLTNHFGMSRPTTVQFQAIKALVNSSSKPSSAEPNTARSNVLIHSETGSGKTLAYGLPILQSLVDKYTDKSTSQIARPSRQEIGIQCIIVCPTRDLALQTLKVWERLCAHSFGWMVPGGLVGSGNNVRNNGSSAKSKDTRQSEKARLRKGLAIIVATPGRLLDHLSKTESLVTNLRKGTFQWLVLDEADRLLEDRGDRELVRQIVQRLRAATSDRRSPSSGRWRTCLVSATATKSLQSIAKEVVCGEDEATRNIPWTLVKGTRKKKGDGAGNASPKQSKDNVSEENELAISKAGDEMIENESASLLFSESTPRQLAQLHLTVNAKLRLTTLIALLVERVKKHERTIVFMDTRASVDYHYELFRAMDPIVPSPMPNSKSTTVFGSTATLHKLHGNMSLVDRQKVLRSFTSSRKSSSALSSILLATDVAARGLDLDGIDWTVQYDPPCQITDYVHRVGRVARAGKAGHSLLFLLPSERILLDVLLEKGISSENLTAVSLANTLNQAARICGTMDSPNRTTKATTAPATYKGKNSSRLGEAFSTDIQRRLEDCVAATQQQKGRDEMSKQQRKRSYRNNKQREEEQEENASPDLFGLARAAFLSHIRAYPTKEKSIRHIFSARALHLGHVARSFALKEPPKSLASTNQPNAKAKAELRRKKGDDVDDEEIQRPSALAFQETFLSGDIEPESKRSKKNRNGCTTKQSKKTEKDGKAVLLENASKMQRCSLLAL